MRRAPPTFATYSVTTTSAADSPDGVPNYALRSAPAIIAGVNSASLFDPNVPAATTRERGQTLMLRVAPHGRTEADAVPGRASARCPGRLL
jgi:hypothetical protein